jgi:hypothetical protein
MSQQFQHEWIYRRPLPFIIQRKAVLAVLGRQGQTPQIRAKA